MVAWSISFSLPTLPKSISSHNTPNAATAFWEEASVLVKVHILLEPVLLFKPLRATKDNASSSRLSITFGCMLSLCIGDKLPLAFHSVAAGGGILADWRMVPKSPTTTKVPLPKAAP